MLVVVAIGSNLGGRPLEIGRVMADTGLVGGRGPAVTIKRV